MRTKLMCKIVVVGHMPPPVTGENLCRQRLVDTLSEILAIEVLSVRRGLGVMRARGEVLILLNGQSFLGTIFDIFATLWGLTKYGRIYWYFHNASWRRFKRIPNWVWLGQADKIVAVVLRTAIADEMTSVGYHSTVIHNRIEGFFEGPHNELPEIPLKRLVWMGRPDSAKGFPFALRVFSRLRENCPEWIFDVYGADEAFAHQNGFKREGVTFRGFISGPEKVLAFRKGGIFILPSKYKNETQPLSIIEALCCGIPVVASDVGGIKEMIESNESVAGFCLSTFDVETYVNAVQRAMIGYTELSGNASAIYRSTFSVEIFAKNVAEIFCHSDSRI